MEVHSRLLRAPSRKPGGSSACSRRGQGFVEFSLVLPVFLISLFALINAGFLLYSINAVDQSATVGSNSIAASGNSPTADILGVQRMAAAGLGTTALITVSRIDVELLNNDMVKGGFMVNADGSPQVATTCGPNGNLTCDDTYTFVGGANATVTVVNQGAYSPCGSASQCPPWMPESRNVTANTTDPDGAGPSFVALVITYRYGFMGAPVGGLNLTSTKTFRLEPQQ